MAVMVLNLYTFSGRQKLIGSVTAITMHIFIKHSSIRSNEQKYVWKRLSLLRKCKPEILP